MRRVYFSNSKFIQNLYKLCTNSVQTSLNADNEYGIDVTFSTVIYGCTVFLRAATLFFGRKHVEKVHRRQFESARDGLQ